MARKVKSFTSVESKFPEVRRLAQRHVSNCLEKAADAGHDITLSRLKPGRGVDTGRYRSDIRKEVTGDDAAIVARGNPETLPSPGMLEFGTADTAAVPHIRPGHTRMKKVFLAEVDGLGLGRLRTRKLGGQQRRR